MTSQNPSLKLLPCHLWSTNHQWQKYHSMTKNENWYEYFLTLTTHSSVWNTHFYNFKAAMLSVKTKTMHRPSEYQSLSFPDISATSWGNAVRCSAQPGRWLKVLHYTKYAHCIIHRKHHTPTNAQPTINWQPLSLLMLNKDITTEKISTVKSLLCIKVSMLGFSNQSKAVCYMTNKIINCTSNYTKPCTHCKA